MKLNSIIANACRFRLEDRAKKQLKESEQVELVSDAEQSAADASTASPAVGHRPPDESLTPWKKHRDPGVVKNRKRMLMVGLAAIILAPLLAVGSAIRCIPNGVPLIEMQTGILFGNRALILQAYKDGFGNKPEFVGAMINAANQRAAADRNAAIELYNDCVRINPNFANCYMNRGLNYECLNKYDLAVKDFDKAIALNPQYSLAFNNRACLYLSLKKYDRALLDHSRAIAIEPSKGMYYYNRALTYGKMGQYKQTIADLEKCQSLGYYDAGVKSEMEWARSQL